MARKLTDEPSSEPVRQFAPAKRIRAYESVVEQIENAILHGELRPGQRLPSERELTAQFAVSRATVREALRVLESQGLVKSRQGDPTGGAVVQEFSPDALNRSLTTMVHLEQFDLADLVQFRMTVEGSATFLAAISHTPEQLAAMKAAHAAATDAIRLGYEAFSAADVDFHRCVAEAAGSGLLRVCNDVACGVVMNLIEAKLKAAVDIDELMRDSCHRHGLVLEQIEKRNGTKAARMALQDMMEHYGPFIPDERRAPLDAFAARAPMG
ncbi:GntR family transcriptional regulator [Mycolicibacterium goodii]|uniref:FadR/GntR family transcriptional regulator n=1 Tax=Mycolicibacterium goodii TaxID=134601 RepID=UPI000C2605BE|nr:GntR family transcriptional regulator [Mycolicibacterium goodii]PJK22590.1 GntR family transcriptional regulator [Mycolicibacterium goodii]ULN49218.1 GntR family transcriptional regulator [Mycolicibacterium goodii]